jgi:hypothetical protein
MMPGRSRSSTVRQCPMDGRRVWAIVCSACPHSGKRQGEIVCRLASAEEAKAKRGRLDLDAD